MDLFRKFESAMRYCFFHPVLRSKRYAWLVVSCSSKTPSSAKTVPDTFFAVCIFREILR